MGEYYSGKEYQKHIHFPKTGILCKKDSLARVIKKNRVGILSFLKILYDRTCSGRYMTFLLPLISYLTNTKSSLKLIPELKPLEMQKTTFGSASRLIHPEDVVLLS
jgi:hypothetical protein